MKIKDIEVIHLRVEHPNLTLCDGSYDGCVIRVRTDEGITGIAEVESLAPAIQGIVYARPAHSRACGLRDLLIGCDPADPSELWEQMYQATYCIGRRGLVMHAISGIDIALWDIKGQMENQPISQLIGGARRDRIEAYGTIYPLAKTPEGVEQQVNDATERLRLRNIKLVADPWWMDDLDLTASLLHAARRSMGDDRGMIVDAQLAYDSVDHGLRLIPILQSVGVLFFEAPLPMDDTEGHARLAKTGLPLGVGDMGFTDVKEFVEAMDRGHAEICQPDITNVGGFTGIRKIAEQARKRGKRILPHGYKSNIEIAANLNFLAAHWQPELLEYSTSQSPLRWEMTEEQLVVETDGTVKVPRGAGLGVRLKEETITRYRVT